LDDAGIEYGMPLPLSSRPDFGLSDREVARRAVDLNFPTPFYQRALARGDVSMVREALTELLDIFRVNLDPKCEAYRTLGMAVLEAQVKAIHAIRKRDAGEPVDSPPVPALAADAPATGETLRAAFEGWKKERSPAAGTLREYDRAINLFVELHGDLPVVGFALSLDDPCTPDPSARRSRGIN
jgi:hypothetical protein